MFECVDAATCPGGAIEDVAAGDSVCAENRDPNSVACAKCLEGYRTKDGGGNSGACQACPSAEWEALFFAVVILPLLFIIVLAVLLLTLNLVANKYFDYLKKK